MSSWGVRMEFDLDSNVCHVSLFEGPDRVAPDIEACHVSSGGGVPIMTIQSHRSQALWVKVIDIQEIPTMPSHAPLFYFLPSC